MSDLPRTLTDEEAKIIYLAVEKRIEAETEKYRSAIRETINRWSHETGDGSMWGEDAWVLGPIREAIGDPLTANEQKSAGQCSEVWPGSGKRCVKRAGHELPHSDDATPSSACTDRSESRPPSSYPNGNPSE